MAFPHPGDLLDAGIKPTSPESLSLASGFFHTEPPGNPLFKTHLFSNIYNFNMILITKFGYINNNSICQQIWKTQQWPQDWRSSVFIPVPRKDRVKEYTNYLTTALISCARKLMLKILQARLQQYMKQELSDIKHGFRKSRGTRNKIANIHWIIEKAREFQKKKHLLLLHWLH